MVVRLKKKKKFKMKRHKKMIPFTYSSLKAKDMLR